jgi:hypothetical protein
MLKMMETYVNKDKEHIYSETEPYEPYTDNIGELFRECQFEFGRCVSSMYVDLVDGTTRKCGWVFEKRREYDRSTDTYIQETWVHLFEQEN